MLGNVGMIWSVGKVCLPLVGQRNERSRDFKGRLDAGNELFDDGSLCCIGGRQKVARIEKLDLLGLALKRY